MRHSRGVSLRELRATGRRYWRDEAKADGGKRMLRRLVRAHGKQAWRREWGLV